MMCRYDCAYDKVAPRVKLADARIDKTGKSE